MQEGRERATSYVDAAENSGENGTEETLGLAALN